jgi:TyrR family helix-turn-helix protein
VSPLSAGQAPGLAEQLNTFEKSILEHAIRQYKTTRKMAEFLKTSQSRIARMLKKHQLSTGS